VATVCEATLELFRAHGMTTIFADPGSTELPTLRDLPADFTYLLGLQEQAVVGDVSGRDELADALRESTADDGPCLVQVPVATGMSFE
jgi:thiamine pyrophosphate-dependent acetolactate synthase large subunit-like protein